MRIVHKIVCSLIDEIQEFGTESFTLVRFDEFRPAYVMILGYWRSLTGALISDFDASEIESLFEEFGTQIDIGFPRAYQVIRPLIPCSCKNNPCTCQRIHPCDGRRGARRCKGSGWTGLQHPSHIVNCVASRSAHVRTKQSCRRVPWGGDGGHSCRAASPAV